jgi:cytochrome c oxidase cbb3-type subunit 4
VSFYDTLRHFADGVGLIAMLVIFVALCLWPFRPGARKQNLTAATMIFKDHDDGR